MPAGFPGTRVGRARSACAGSAAAFLLRQLMMKTGNRSSPSLERILHDLTLPACGADIERLEMWFLRNGGMLRGLGCRVIGRRVVFKTPWLVDWVGKGNGFRGAVLQTDRFRLYDEPSPGGAEALHAVGLGVDESGRKPTLVMIDPWQTSDPIAKIPSTLESAHRAAKYGGLVIHWTGWS